MARLTLFTRRVVVIIWGGVFFLRGGEGCGEDGMGWDGMVLGVLLNVFP